MTHVPDLAATSYLGLEGPVRAVGWLEASHQYTRGPVEPEIADRLMQLIARPIWGFFHLGMYWCSLCEAEGRIGPDYRSSQAVLLVPGSDCVYETPIWIGHYVLRHSYLPPREFCGAVLSCPAPGSDDFLKALVAHIPALPIDRLPTTGSIFIDWSDGAQGTLQPDPENGSEKLFGRRVSEAKRPSRDQAIREHGGLSSVACAWRGCDSLALSDMAICYEHAHPEGWE